MIILPNSRQPFGALTFVMTYLTISTTIITTSATILRGRESATCAKDPNLLACNNGLPSQWCCPQNTSCLQLNNTVTDVVICCPNSSTGGCQTLLPISCNITLQDPNLFPEAAVHVGNTSLTLPTCGTQCCPIGYSCGVSNGQAACLMSVTSRSPEISSSASLSSTVTTSVSSTTSKPTVQAASSSPTAAASGSGGFSKGAWAAIGTILGLIVAAIIGFTYLFYRRKSAVAASKSSSTSGGEESAPPIPISEPIFDPQLAARTDFLNRYRTDPISRPSDESTFDFNDDDDEKSKSSTRPSTAKSAAPVRDSIQVRRDKKKTNKSVKKQRKPRRDSSPTRMVMVKMDTSPVTKSPPPSYNRQQPVGILKNAQSPAKKPEVYVPKGNGPAGVGSSKGMVTLGTGSPTSQYSRATRAESLAVVVDGNGSPAKVPRPALERGGPVFTSQKYQYPS